MAAVAMSALFLPLICDVLKDDWSCLREGMLTVKSEWNRPLWTKSAYKMSVADQPLFWSYLGLIYHIPRHHSASGLRLGS